MKILFQVLFFLGVFSFLGGLMNGVFFIIGIIIAVIFGYLGFIHKEKDNRNIVNRKETGDYNKKMELLQKAFDNGVLNQAEFEKKKIELFALNLDQEDERNKEEKRKILDDLLRKGLVTQSEYDKKKKVPIDVLKLKGLKKKPKASSFTVWLFALVIFCITTFLYLYSING